MKPIAPKPTCVTCGAAFNSPDAAWDHAIDNTGHTIWEPK